MFLILYSFRISKPKKVILKKIKFRTVPGSGSQQILAASIPSSPVKTCIHSGIETVLPKTIFSGAKIKILILILSYFINRYLPETSVSPYLALRQERSMKASWSIIGGTCIKLLAKRGNSGVRSLSVSTN